MSTKVFPKEPTFNISKKIAFYYPSGAQSHDLDDFVNAAMSVNIGKYALCFGDDSAIFDQDNHEQIETDYSMFDSTQTWDGALHVLPTVMCQNGHTKMAEIYHEMYQERIVCLHRKSSNWVKLPWSEPPWRLTGEPGTSIGNTLVNIYATKFAIESGLPQAYSALGLKVKRKVVKDMSITFLKGTWLLAKDSLWHWIRLPSFLLKFGKIMSNPRVTKPKKWSMETAYHQALWSQWLGYGHMSHNWFYRAIGKEIHRLTPQAIGGASKLEDHQIVTSGSFEIDDDDWNAFMMSRYKISLDIQLEFIEDLRKITHIPCVCTSFLLDILYSFE
jgi:hypothetical protein